ncbi:MAG: hypothetical protein U1A27_05875 [Phycisphaerae bacterium]
MAPSEPGARSGGPVGRQILGAVEAILALTVLAVVAQALWRGRLITSFPARARDGLIWLSPSDVLVAGYPIADKGGVQLCVPKECVLCPLNNFLGGVHLALAGPILEALPRPRDPDAAMLQTGTYGGRRIDSSATVYLALSGPGTAGSTIECLRRPPLKITRRELLGHTIEVRGFARNMGSIAMICIAGEFSIAWPTDLPPWPAEWERRDVEVRGVVGRRAPDGRPWESFAYDCLVGEDDRIEIQHCAILRLGDTPASQ